MIDTLPINILVVDDEPFMLKLHAKSLSNLGYTNVTLCESAPGALQIIDVATTQPDLILTDLNMPGMDGVELIRHLVTRGFGGSLALVSGEDERLLQTAEKLAQAHEIKILGYLRKPVKPEMLAKLLAKWTPPKAELWSPLDLTKTAKLRIRYSPQEIHAAIDNNELVMHYQPKVSLLTGQIVGMEALVRWAHPKEGLIYPDRFIEVAEMHGLIKDITRAVVVRTLTDAKSWQDQTGLPLHIAINVSMNDLNDLDFADHIAGETAIVGLAAKAVTLEVTESRLMKDFRSTLEILTRLRLKRFKLSIDDFGTGHSSLAQLRDIPFDELKIDRGFVHRAWENETGRVIFDTSVTLAKQLNMQIVAEGVEDRADWDFVRRSGCHAAQGYFIGKPMPIAALHDWMEEWEERGLGGS